MIILYASINPQPISGLIQTKQDIDWDALGYATDENNKPIREFRFYLSKEMKALRDWATKFNLGLRFGPGRANEPFSFDNLLEVHGDFTQEVIDAFPIEEYEAMQIHSRKDVI